MDPQNGFLEVIFGFLKIVCQDKRLCSSYYEEYQSSDLNSNPQIFFGVLEIKVNFFHRQRS